MYTVCQTERRVVCWYMVYGLADPTVTVTGTEVHRCSLALSAQHMETFQKQLINTFSSAALLDYLHSDCWWVTNYKSVLQSDALSAYAFTLTYSLPTG